MSPRRRIPVARRIDLGVGEALSRGVQAHHRRRLARVGKHPMDAPPGGWARDAPDPRRGNRMTPLIDGEQALGRMVEAIDSATSSVWLTGWFLSPEFVMRGGPDPVVVRNLLAEASRRVDVRVLLWAGAPIPLFKPSRRMARAVAAQLTGAGIRCELDALERPLHCHREKTIIVDGRIAFVGGIDLTALAGARLDSSLHPPRAAVGSHDVSAEVKGPVVADVARHFAMRWHSVTGERLPQTDPAPEAGGSTVRLVRTVPEHRYPGLPARSFGILETYVRAITSARELISLESQYLWSTQIVHLLAEKLPQPAHRSVPDSSRAAGEALRRRRRHAPERSPS